MARDLRDEMQSEGMNTNGEAPAQEGQAAPLSPVQLPLSKRHQVLAARLVMEDFNAAKTARDQRDYGKSSKGDTLHYSDWLKQLTDLYFGYREPKTTPWQFCSNRSMMIAMAILETLQARLFPGTYNEDSVRWRPARAVFAERAEKIEQLMFWWVRVHTKMRDFFDRWVRHAIGFGRVLTISSWEVELLDKGNMTPEEPMTDELGFPMTNPDGTPMVIPAQKMLDREDRTRVDIIPDEDIFLTPGSCNTQRDPVIIRRHYLFRDLEDLERDGKLINITQPTEPGITPLKDMLTPSPSPQGAETEEEDEELKMMKLRSVPVDLLEEWTAFDMDGDTFPEQIRLFVVDKYELYVGGMALKDISKRGKRPLDLTFFMPRLGEPNGTQGIGVLEQVKELALEIDAIFNQMTDANTLQVLRPGFFDPFGEVKASELRLAPNKWHPVPNPQQSVYVPEFNIQTEKLILSIRLVMEFIERLTAASAYVMGKESEIVGGSGTATRTQAIVGAANERHSVPVANLRDGVARILTILLDLLQKNLPPGLEERVLGPKNEQLFENPVSSAAIEGEYDAYLLPDDSLGSKEAQRLLAQNLYALLSQNLLVATDPAKLYKVTADVVKAWGKDPAIYLGPAPDVRATDSPDEEHELMLAGEFRSVRASVVDNPIEHVLGHQQFLQSPALQILTPEAQAVLVQAVQAHIQEHIQMFQLMLMATQKGKQGGGSFGGEQAGQAKPSSPSEAQPGVGSVQEPAQGALGAQVGGESLGPA